MKKFILMGAIALLSIAACQQNTNKNNAATPTDQHAAHTYACPMECEGEKTYPAPGSCPVCKMDLEEVVAK